MFSLTLLAYTPIVAIAFGQYRYREPSDPADQASPTQSQQIREQSLPFLLNRAVLDLDGIEQTKVQDNSSL